ncbi:MAG TPA: arylsulfatase [Verrucomicrobiota bacterium]|nr:sulfatase [Verrucomicrobiales bacterium]HRI13958.1 arylsulfatase [Verrucomicrobiota bacterium]
MNNTLAICAAWLITGLSAHAAASQPNIVHIVADDLGWKDVGFNGCKDIKTPNLDKLAAGGAKFTQFYAQPMCTPTRACLMTGRYPWRYGLQTMVIPGTAGYGLDTSEWLMPQCLAEVGYTTAIIGKWHLGHADLKYWPKQRGFDYAYGATIGELDYYTHGDAGVLDWFRDNKPVHEEGYTTTLIGDDAVRYINKQDPSKPFYLYLAFNAPHTPYLAPKEIIAKYSSIADPTRRTYAAMVDCLDENIGKVVAALDKKGLRDNTLILFHSDNGGTHNAMFAGQMADVSKIKIPCDNSPYRDGKGSVYEGGCRVVALANWPGHIKPQTVDGIIHVVDLYPTLAKLAGASTAKCKPLDGVNVWDVIAENKPSPRTEVIYNVEPFRGSVRQGDWKLIWRTLIPTSVELYNLAEDPYEKNNVAAAHPDKVAALQARLNALGKESTKPLALEYLAGVGLKHDKPIIGSESGQPQALIGNGGGPLITDEGFGENDTHP